MYLGMTTNERLNAGRYTYLHMDKIEHKVQSMMDKKAGKQHSHGHGHDHCRKEGEGCQEKAKSPFK